ncbi:MAG TPA: C4-dicarboxylate ABC transporter permease, partial [Deltaproteobacteria bacterium]|nr:C4-dicarboxylate ABC transporter permease [Deltaproteobacteria bacterium]
MNEVIVGIIGLIVILLMFLTGIELAFAMILIGFLGFGYLVSWGAAFNLLAKDMFDVLNSYSFTVIPLFVFMGQLAFNSGIAKRLFDAAYKFIGHIPGGLAMATVAGATVFKSICGSSPATAATFASVAVPEMERYGYDRKLSTGIVATVGTLGIIIPPSVTLICYGIITDQSIGRLFLAGIFPGLVIAFFFICIIYGWCKIIPAAGPVGPKFAWGQRLRSMPEVVWVIFIFFLVIG